jgi:hypothetical protein
MLYVKLLKDVGEGNVDLQAARAAHKGGGAKPPPLKTAKVRGQVLAYVAGAVVPMHEAAAAKYLDRGLGEVVVAE